jgi:MFS family permease
MSPESPRWLASQDRTNEARAFLVKYHAGGDEQSPLAEFELAEITRTLRLEREAKKSASYLDMLRTRGNRWRTFITIFLGVFDQWAGQNIASYYLSPVLTTIGVTSVTNQTMISGFLQLWNLFWALAGSFCVDLVGRRFLFLSSCAGMLASYIVITALSATFANTGAASVGIAVIPFLFIMYAFFAIAFTPLFVAYPVEIWKYQLRSRGLGLGLISTYVAVFFNIFVNPIALEAIAWKYYLVYCIILTGGGLVIYFTFPETRGHSLEEMARIFDGADADVPDEHKIMEEVLEHATIENTGTIHEHMREKA